MFPWVKDAAGSSTQNVMNLVVTGVVVVLSLLGLILISIGGKKEDLRSLSALAMLCLVAMLMGPLGTAAMPKAVFGIFERFSTFSAVVFNAVLGIYLMVGKLGKST